MFTSTRTRVEQYPSRVLVCNNGRFLRVSYVISTRYVDSPDPISDAFFADRLTSTDLRRPATETFWQQHVAVLRRAYRSS